MATPNITIDPLTRIEGHLAIEAVAENGVITDAWVVSTLYRGIETILKGRAPEDAFYVTQRICGVCPTSHGHASSMAVEAVDKNFKLPNGARLVRNILEGAEWLHSHVLWFYTLAGLDYVNPAKALAANVANTYSLAKEKGIATADYSTVQARLLKLVEGGDLSIFSNGWWGINPLVDPGKADELYNPAIPAELHLIGVSQYLEALDVQAKAAQIIALLGGKFPHPMTSVAGGTAWMPTPQKLDDALYRLKEVCAFIQDKMVPFTFAIAPYFAGALEYGQGCGNFLSWGVFNRESMLPEDRILPAGFIKTANGLTVERPDFNAITEDVKRAWYQSDTGLNPMKGETKAVDKWENNLDGQYSWGKAPLYDGDPMEAGPLARVLVAYLDKESETNEFIAGIVDGALKTLGITDPTKLISLLGRVAARNLEAYAASLIAEEWVMELVEVLQSGKAEFWAPYNAGSGEGAGLWEAPRGALGHFINTKGGKITRYQVVTPSTWDLAPRSDDGAPGPMEAALIGTPVADVERPIEAARIVRSFDP